MVRPARLVIAKSSGHDATAGTLCTALVHGGRLSSADMLISNLLSRQQDETPRARAGLVLATLSVHADLPGNCMFLCMCTPLLPSVKAKMSWCREVLMPSILYHVASQTEQLTAYV
jgi:hypothetical protein